VLALPWLVMSGVAATLGLLAGIRDPRRWQIGTRHAIWAALAFLAVGAGNAMSDRLGIQPFGFSPTIVLLTAVHFHVAGFVLVVAGALTHQRTGSVFAGVGVAAVIVGMPITALGFFGVPVANLAGAVVVSLGGLGIAVGTLRSATTFRSPWARRLGWLSGLSLLVAMPLALAYAIGSALGTAWLDLPTMARTHGALNALGFALPAMVSLILEHRAVDAPVTEPAGPTDVIGFNVAPLILGPLAGLVAVVTVVMPLPLAVRVALLVAGLGAIGLTIVAVVAIWWVFGIGSERRWTWVASAAGRPKRWLNLTTGFDDSTVTLRRRIAGEGRTVDVFDPSVEHEAALRRARVRFPTPGPGASVAPAALDDVVAAGSADTVFLLMSAHEAHGQDRLALIRSAARAVTPGGRLVLVEHLRNAANVAAFGPGAWHFATRAEWLAIAREAGLTLEEETRLTPLVAGFVFRQGAHG
jgi:SAM-dependent methyltransferase